MGRTVTRYHAPRPRPAHRSSPLALIADGSIDLTDMLEAYLETRGFECRVARSGARLVPSAHALAPDVVLTDIMLPGTDAWTALRQLKAREATRHIPVVVWTGYLHAWTRQRVLDAGCQFLAKPCDADVLVTTLFDAMTRAHPA
jgi:CheY-like chemotaxis protein